MQKVINSVVTKIVIPANLLQYTFAEAIKAFRQLYKLACINTIPNIRISSLIFFCFITFLFYSCEKLDLERKNPNDIYSPNYYNIDAKVSTDTSYLNNIGEVIIKGTLHGINDYTEITDYGFCWSTSTSPSINSSIISFGSARDNVQFDTTINDLLYNNHYYFSAYMIYNNDVKYGKIKILYYSNYWTQKPDFGGSARDKAVSFSISSKGYVGTGNDGNILNDFWEYNPSTETWTQKQNFGGSARCEAVGFSIGNKGYIGTGNDGNMLNDFWEYNPSTDTWIPKADFGGGERKGAVGFSIGNKGYIGTGRDVNYNKRTDFWEYNPSNDTWTQKADFGGSERDNAVGFSIGEKGYIGTAYWNDFWEYDPATDTWTQKADFGGTARFGAVGFSIGSKGYIGPGRDAGTFEGGLWEYNPTLDIWIQKADFPGLNSCYAIGFSIGEKGYIGTGGNDGSKYYKDFWEYNP